MIAVLRGRGKHRQRSFDEQRALSHYLAGLVGYAFHAPAKMPEFREGAGEPKREVSTEADDARVRAYFIGLAMRGR